MKILVTGYGPFYDTTVNPSQVIAELINGENFYGVDIIGIPVEVSWGIAWDTIKKALDTHKPDVLISFGIGDFFIKLEEYGINYMSGAPGYNDKPGKSGKIIEGGAKYLDATLPRNFIARGFQQYLDGQPHTITDRCEPGKIIEAYSGENAGSFLCNYALYHGAYYQKHQRNHQLKASGFIHIPPFNNNNPDDEKGYSIIQSGTLVVKLVAQWLANYEKPLLKAHNTKAIRIPRLN